ncbi:MAG: hypothetical protein ACE5I1_09390 [bacterium]
MLKSKLFQGEMKGRIMDAQGFEGDLKLNLQRGEKKGSLGGAFRITLGVNHASATKEGEITGSFSKNRIKLVFEFCENQHVTIRMNGNVFPLMDGGIGLKGTYDVHAHGFSPLQGGIVVANKDQPFTSVQISTQSVLVQSLDTSRRRN